MVQPILALIIPVYHEEENIISLLRKISEHIKIPIKVYFVYDTDEDPTVRVINEQVINYNFPIQLVRNNYGDGALNAIKTGFEKFEEEACVVVMGDGSDDLSSINGMYGLFCQGFHIVCGSRYMRNGKQIGGSRIKKTLSRLAGLSLYYFSSITTHDVTNSYKLYTKKIINKINIESSGGFEIGMEIVVKSHCMDYAIAEVPTVWHDRYEGTSNFKMWAWLPHYLKWYIFLLIRKPFFRKSNIKTYNNIRAVGY